MYLSPLFLNILWCFFHISMRGIPFVCVCVYEHMHACVHGGGEGGQGLCTTCHLFYWGSSQSRDRTRVSHIAGRFSNACATREAHLYNKSSTIPRRIIWSRSMSRVLISITSLTSIAIIYRRQAGISFPTLTNVIKHSNLCQYQRVKNGIGK